MFRHILVVVFLVSTTLTANANKFDKKFSDFFDQFKNSEMLSPALKVALENHGGHGGLAVDIGAGTGRDTIHLLRSGFKVVSIDPADTAINEMNRRFKGEYGSKIETVKAKIEDYDLPQNIDLANITWTIRFLDPKKFNQTFDKITKSIKVGGRFTGDFCGEKWGHVGKKREGLFHTYKEIMDLLAKNYKIEYFKEKLKIHNDQFTEHLYEVVAIRIK